MQTLTLEPCAQKGLVCSHFLSQAWTSTERPGSGPAAQP